MEVDIRDTQVCFDAQGILVCNPFQATANQGEDTIGVCLDSDRYRHATETSLDYEDPSAFWTPIFLRLNGGLAIAGALRHRMSVAFRIVHSNV